MTCKARHISLEILRIRSRPDCCNAAMFWNCVSSHGSQASSGPFVFGAGGPFLPAVFSQGSEMELLKVFFTFWSATIIALLTLLGVDVIHIWMLDRLSSKT
jgi:hypothetical protein